MSFVSSIYYNYSLSQQSKVWSEGFYVLSLTSKVCQVRREILTFRTKMDSVSIVDYQAFYTDVENNRKLSVLRELCKKSKACLYININIAILRSKAFVKCREISILLYY